ncbi:hypothetical protein O9H85_16445 [Paenibacillus filicis]|uniref:Uncharacterized protein n=1 Tax=Paenibacillus gyeongsangnamensis TaxID=3388067 RepID=A0ABT4QB46_9BACL|nr:hypothetical protein [Paenibacillus filicis]MCZ8513982.1 hypothetical protein [Paenibacillus filicis]
MTKRSIASAYPNGIPSPRELHGGGKAMGSFLHLADLYPRPLIPIGREDRMGLEDMYTGKDGRPGKFTDWLIALMWVEDPPDRGWKVVVFPVSVHSVFWASPPLFHTLAPGTFEKAWKLSEAIKTSSEQDRLTRTFVHPYWDYWEAI